MKQERVPRDCGETMFTTEEVAQRLRITPKTVREWIGRGELAAWDAGQGYRIFQRDLDVFIEQRMHPRKGQQRPAGSQRRP